MRWLLFLSRLAFICGIFFLLSISLLFSDWAKDQDIVSTIIIIGHVLGMILVPVVDICYLVVFIWKKQLKPYVPVWLIISNILFLGILALYLFLSNG